MSKRKKPEVRIHIQTDTHPDAVRIEILISGADEAARDLVKTAIRMAVDSVTEDQS